MYFDNSHLPSQFIPDLPHPPNFMVFLSPRQGQLGFMWPLLGVPFSLIHRPGDSPLNKPDFPLGASIKCKSLLSWGWSFKAPCPPPWGASARDFQNTRMIFFFTWFYYVFGTTQTSLGWWQCLISCSDQRMWQQPVLYDCFLNDRILKTESKAEGTRTARRNISVILRSLPGTFKGICPRPRSLLCLLMRGSTCTQLQAPC